MELCEKLVRPLMLGSRAKGERVIQAQVLESHLAEGRLGGVPPGRVLFLTGGGGVDALAQELAGIVGRLAGL